MTRRDTILITCDNAGLATVRLQCARCGDHNTFSFPIRHVAALGQAFSEIARRLGVTSTITVVEDGGLSPVGPEPPRAAKERVH